MAGRSSPIRSTTWSYPSTGASYNRVFNALVPTFPALEANRGAPMAFRWRSLPLGNRAFTTTTDTRRYLAALEGPLGFLSQWDYRLGASRASSKGKSVLNNGYVYTVPFVNLINTGVVDPFSYTQTPEAMAAIDKVRAERRRPLRRHLSHRCARRRRHRPALHTPGRHRAGGGGPRLAPGTIPLQRRQPHKSQLVRRADLQRALRQRPRDQRRAQAHDQSRVCGTPGADHQGPRPQRSPAASTTTPVLAARKNPKLTLRYTLNEAILVRSSYSTGFRVPTFKQHVRSGDREPARRHGPDRSGHRPPNPAELRTTRSSAARVTSSPKKPRCIPPASSCRRTSNVSFNVDWWHVDRTGTIQSFGTTVRCSPTTAVFQDRFRRNAPTATISRRSTARWVNAGAKRHLRRIEFGVKGDTDVAGGKLSAPASTSPTCSTRSRKPARHRAVQRERNQHSSPARATSDCKLEAHGQRQLPPRQLVGQVNNLYRNSYTDAVLPGVAAGRVIPPDWQPRVKPYSIYGLSVSYRGIKNTTIIAGVKNLLNEDPPFSATYDTNTGAGSSWEPRIADPRGRSFTLRVDYRFF
jgi:iron complex outermembrane receptor protein